MSSVLAIASVTAVLKNLLENGLANRGISASIGGETLVSALPPDRIATGNDERAQINLFMYHATPNTSLRSARRLERNERRLALDLYYLLTAYGAQDFQFEILLGCAIQLLQQTPALNQDTIRSILTSISANTDNVLPPAQAALAASELADQVEQIMITPQFLNIEELSKLWSAFQARYRPSAAYKVSMMLIEGNDQI